MNTDEAKIRKELKEMFGSGLTRNVELLINPEITKNEESSDLIEFVTDLATLSEKIKVVVGPPIDAEGPKLSIGNNLGYNISFLGVPSGLEIQSLLKAILLVSQGEDAVQANLKSIAQKITVKHEIDVFVSAKCSDCPMPVFYLLSTAVSNPEHISAQIIMTSSYPNFSKERGVKHLPTFFTDGVKASIETDKISIGLFFEYIKGLCA